MLTHNLLITSKRVSFSIVLHSLCMTIQFKLLLIFNLCHSHSILYQYFTFQGSLIVWDVRSGEPVRAVRLGHRDNAVFVRQIMSCGDAILCDYGCALRLVRFPSVINKID